MVSFVRLPRGRTYLEMVSANVFTKSGILFLVFQVVRVISNHVLLSRIQRVLHALNDTTRTHKEEFKANLNDNLHLIQFNSEQRGSCVNFSTLCHVYERVPNIPCMKNLSQIASLQWNDSLETHFGVSNEAFFNARGVSAISTCNSFSQDDPKHGLILAMAEGYDCNRVSLFLKSLRDSGSLAHVVLFRSDAHTSPCREIVESCSLVSFEEISGFPTVKPEVRRYILALQFLSRRWNPSHRCSRVVVMDFKDAFFQGNPFTLLDKVNADVILTEEAYDT